MTEAARLSVAVEVTGEEAFKQSMAGIERSGQKAKAAVDAAASGMGKDLAQLDAMIAKSVGGITAAIDRQTASIGKGFAQVSAQMRLVQSGVGSAATSVEKDAGRAQSAFDRMDSLIARNTASIQAALGQIAPASAAMANDIGQSSQAMASFEAAAASMNAATANLQDSIRDVSAAMAKFNSEASKPANDNPYDKPAKGAATLRAELNPLFAIGEQYHAQVARIRQAHTDGAIGAAEMAMALQRAGAVADAQQRQYVKMDAALGATGDAARLTSNQMLNLSRQGNDVITMFAMGAPPMQIFASQAGQIYGALEEGPRGLRGSLEAIKGAVMGFAAGLGPAGIALGALGAAAVTFGIATRRNVEPIEDVIKAQADSVRQLRDAYGLAGDAAEDYARRSVLSLRLDAREGNRTSIDRARAGFRDQFTSQYAGSFNRLNEMRFAGATELRAAFDELNRSIEAGTPRFIEFREQLASIPDTDLPYFIKEAIQANREWANTFVPLQQQIEGAEAALDGTAQAAKRYKDAMSDLVSLTPDLRTNAERINEAFEIARSSSADGDEEMTAILQRQKAMAADTAGALEIYTQARADLAAVGLGDDARAIAQINAQYDALEDQYLGNADALEALVDARQAAIDTVNAQSAFDASEKAKKDADEYTRALADQARGIDEQVAGLQRQVQTFGQSEGAIRANEERARMLAAAYQLASDNNAVVTPAQIAQIDQAAAAIGGLTDQLIAMREAEAQAKRISETIADLQFQGSLFGLSDVDREIATTLNGLKLTYESFDGQRIAGAIRYNATLEETQDQLEKQRELVENVASSLLDIFTDTSSDSFFDRITDGLAAVSAPFTNDLSALFQGDAE